MLGSTGTLIKSINISLSSNSYVWAIATVGTYNTSINKDVNFYIKIDGNQGNVTTNTVPNQSQGGKSSTTLHHFAGPFGPTGTLPVEVYGWDGNPSTVRVIHIDLFAMGNLAYSP